MAKQVDDREKELTFLTHKAMITLTVSEGELFSIIIRGSAAELRTRVYYIIQQLKLKSRLFD